MKFLEEHILVITALTPVHIGCGEDYTPTDYVIDDGALFAFDSAGLDAALPDMARKELLRLVKENQPDLSSIQKLFYNHRKALMVRAHHCLPVAPSVTKLYQERIGKTAQHEESGKKVLNRLEIERTFYNPLSHQPVIPGSSLKGAIRTALLDGENNGQTLRYTKEKNKDMQQRLFQYKDSALEKDPMRLIHLADTETDARNTAGSEIRFAVNRPREEPKRNPSHQRKKAQDGNLYQLLETLPESELRAYRSRLTLHKVDSIQESDKLPIARLRWTMRQIAQACNRFYLPLLEQEMKRVKQREYVSPDWAQRMDKLLECIKPRLDKDQAMLLRVGRHSGAEAVTLNGVRSIKIMQGKKGHGKGERHEPQPRTLWLAADAQGLRSEMTPFGWALVEIDPQEQPPAGLEQLLEQSAATKQKWSARQKQRLTELQNELEQRQQQEEAERQQQEKEQREEEKKKEILAAMTDQQRAIFEWEEAFNQAKASGQLKPQHVVMNRLSELMKKASDWSEQDRNKLCDLAESAYKPLGMLQGKKGRERKETIRTLRG